jgi:hypothetical protein
MPEHQPCAALAGGGGSSHDHYGCRPEQNDVVGPLLDEAIQRSEREAHARVDHRNSEERAQSPQGCVGWDLGLLFHALLIGTSAKRLDRGKLSET